MRNRLDVIYFLLLLNVKVTYNENMYPIYILQNCESIHIFGIL